MRHVSSLESYKHYQNIMYSTKCVILCKSCKKSTIRLGRCHVGTLIKSFLLVIHDNCWHFNDRWPFYFWIYGSWVRSYSHEEQEEERERHHSHDDVKNHLRKRGDRLDVYSTRTAMGRRPGFCTLSQIHGRPCNNCMVVRTR